MKLLIRTTLFLFILVFGILYFNTVTELSRSGDVIVELKKEVGALEHENRELTLDLGEQLLLGHIEKEAQARGLIFDTHFVYIQTTPSSLAVSKR